MAHAPAFSAILACYGVVTSIITPPFSICARLRFSSCLSSIFVFLLSPFPEFRIIRPVWEIVPLFGGCPLRGSDANIIPQHDRDR